MDDQPSQLVNRATAVQQNRVVIRDQFRRGSADGLFRGPKIVVSGFEDADRVGVARPIDTAVGAASQTGFFQHFQITTDRRFADRQLRRQFAQSRESAVFDQITQSISTFVGGHDGALWGLGRCSEESTGTDMTVGCKISCRTKGFCQRLVLFFQPYTIASVQLCGFGKDGKNECPYALGWAAISGLSVIDTNHPLVLSSISNASIPTDSQEKADGWVFWVEFVWLDPM